MPNLIERLLAAYDQIPSRNRQPYGRWIVAIQNGTPVAEIIAEAKRWHKTCQMNPVLQLDIGICGCLLNILENKREQN